MFYYRTHERTLCLQFKAAQTTPYSIHSSANLHKFQKTDAATSALTYTFNII